MTGLLLWKSGLVERSAAQGTLPAEARFIGSPMGYGRRARLTMGRYRAVGRGGRPGLGPSRERRALTCAEPARQHAQLVEHAADAAQAHPPSQRHRLRARGTLAGKTRRAVPSRAGPSGECRGAQPPGRPRMNCGRARVARPGGAGGQHRRRGMRSARRAGVCARVSVCLSVYLSACVRVRVRVWARAGSSAARERTQRPAAGGQLRPGGSDRAAPARRSPPRGGTRRAPSRPAPPRPARAGTRRGPPSPAPPQPRRRAAGRRPGGPGSCRAPAAVPGDGASHPARRCRP